MMTRAMVKNKQLMMRRTVAWLVDEGASYKIVIQVSGLSFELASSFWVVP
jgi:hypothetical protein